MATLIVKIEMENDAFKVNRAAELEVIFDDLIAQVGKWDFKSGRLKDSNGNTCGAFSLGREPPALKSGLEE